MVPGTYARIPKNEAERTKIQVAVSLQSEEEIGILPDVWELIYNSALGFAKAAAVDEMLGNFPSALRSYAKVCYIYSTECVVWCYELFFAETQARILSKYSGWVIL